MIAEDTIDEFVIKKINKRKISIKSPIRFYAYYLFFSNKDFLIWHLLIDINIIFFKYYINRNIIFDGD